MLNTKKIEEARQFSKDAHNSIDQKRKYTGAPYWTHPEKVAERVSLVSSNEEVIIAAFLHDVIEDVYPINKDFSLNKIQDLFGVTVAKLVTDLTNRYSKTSYPSLNRTERKIIENYRIEFISPNAKLIKLADIYDNVSDSDVAGGFGRIYVEEKKEQMLFLNSYHFNIKERAFYNESFEKVLKAHIDLL